PVPSWMVAFLMTMSAVTGSAPRVSKRKRVFMMVVYGGLRGPGSPYRTAGADAREKREPFLAAVEWGCREPIRPGRSHAANDVQVEDPPGHGHRGEPELRGEPVGGRRLT